MIAQDDVRVIAQELRAETEEDLPVTEENLDDAVVTLEQLRQEMHALQERHATDPDSVAPGEIAVKGMELSSASFATGHALLARRVVLREQAMLTLIDALLLRIELLEAGQRVPAMA